jgi:hypothetical protein
MKRLIRGFKAAAGTALLIALAHPSVTFASPFGIDAKTAPIAQSNPHPASFYPTLSPSQKTAWPSAYAPASGSSAVNPRDQRQQARRQRILSAMQKGMQEGSKLSLQPLTSTGTGSGLAINFPGFQQGAVFTSGVSPDDPKNTEVSLSADVNKDGLPDVVNVQLDGTLNVLLNPGKGKLGSMQVSSVNTSATSTRQLIYAQAVDLNGDGYPEIAAIDAHTSGILIFPNQKDGTFGNAVTQQINFNSGSVFGTGGGIAFGDFDGDGTVDMAAFITLYGYSQQQLPQTAFELQVFPGKGDGTFGNPLPEQYTLLNAYATTQPGQIAVADLNNDGNLDIIFMIGGWDEADHPSGELWVSTLFGKGNGKFSNPSTDIPPKNKGATAQIDGNGGLVGGITVQDVDGDGNLDVLFANLADQNLYLSLGNGDGTFQDSEKTIMALGYPDYLGFADITGDGILDVISYGVGYTAVYPGLGKGAFGNPVNYVGVLSGLIEPAPADFDGDGKLDIAITDAATDMTAVQLQTASGTFAASPVLSSTGESAGLFQVVASGDFDGNGTPDVLALDYSHVWGMNAAPNPDLVIGTNDGKGNFKYQIAIPGATLGSISDGYADVDEGLVEPVAADFNGDNISDILLNASDGSLWIALSTGPDTFAAPQQIQLSQTYACHFSRIDIGDVNGDGKKDIVLAYGGDSNCSSGSTPSGVTTLLSEGDGTFTSVFTAIGTSAYMPKLIDFNGDGKLDLALSDIEPYSFTFGFYIVPGKGDGTFNASAATEPLASGTGVTAIIPGDFDGDGKQDLTLGTLMRVSSGTFLPGTTGVETLQGHGDFTFGVPQMYAFGAYAYDGQYADFNGDGRPDLALNVGYIPFIPSSPILGNFGYMVNLGGGAFSTFQTGISTTFDLGGFFSPGDFNDYGNVIIGDFNGDGAPDVLTTVDYDSEEHYSSGLFLNAGAIKFSLAAASTAITQGDTATLTATLAPTVSTQIPTGTVNFYNNGTLLQTVPVSGEAVDLNLTSLPVGSNAITAAYSGDANFNGATATAAVNVTVAALSPDFTLSTPSPSGLTLTAGDTGTVSLSLQGNATFNGAVTLACSGAPSKSTCTVAPASLTLAPGQTLNASVVINTTAATTVQSSAALPASFWMTGVGGVSLAGLVLFLWPGRTRSVLSMGVVLLLLVSGTVATLSLSGCGGGNSKAPVTGTPPPTPPSNPTPVQIPGTPSGTSTITITATSGSTTQTQTLSLTVQ